ncbi:MAG: phosphoribosylformylglycinamidine cyclo-ligase [Humidesulfovibrio sp.]
MSNRADAYKAAGVNIDEANQFVERIKALAQSTHGKGVLSGIGGFGGLYKPDLSNIHAPVLVSGTDGVGTKLKLSFAFGGHDTIGIDLVAMSVNDVLVQGARPLFFLDYFATGRLDADIAVRVIEGVVEGCKQSKCSLLGGETAEMPGFYPDGEYDLSGFCVGMVDYDKIVDGSQIGHDDVIIGLASTGPHANGYSLIRKIYDASGLKPGDILPGGTETVAQALLAPTRIYVQPVLNILRDLPVKGMAHITGGGFYDNLPRVLPKTVTAHVRFGSWPVAPVFLWLKNQGQLSWPEMLQIFNTGIGYVLIVKKAAVNDVMDRLSAMDTPGYVIGEIKPRLDDQEQVQVHFPEA